MLIASGMTLQNIHEFSLNPPVLESSDVSNPHISTDGNRNTDISYLLEKIEDLDAQECINMLHFYSSCISSAVHMTSTDVHVPLSRSHPMKSVGFVSDRSTSSSSDDSSPRSVAGVNKLEFYTTASSSSSSSSAGGGVTATASASVTVDLRTAQYSQSMSSLPAPRKKSSDVRRSFTSKTDDDNVSNRNNEYFSKVGTVHLIMFFHIFYFYNVIIISNCYCHCSYRCYQKKSVEKSWWSPRWTPISWRNYDKTNWKEKNMNSKN